MKSAQEGDEIFLALFCKQTVIELNLLSKQLFVVSINWMSWYEIIRWKNLSVSLFARKLFKFSVKIILSLLSAIAETRAYWNNNLNRYVRKLRKIRYHRNYNWKMIPFKTKTFSILIQSLIKQRWNESNYVCTFH